MSCVTLTRTSGVVAFPVRRPVDMLSGSMSRALLAGVVIASCLLLPAVAIGDASATSSGDGDGDGDGDISAARHASRGDGTTARTMDYISDDPSAANFPGPPRVSANSCARPCKVPNPPIIINVGFERDILRRATLPNDTLVIMLLWSNVRLTRGLVFGANFSCTIFNATRPGRLTISLPNTATPVLELFNTHNVLVHGINFHIPVTDAETTICRFPNIDQVRDIYIGRYACPAIFLFRVFAVQVTQGTVFGRIDVMRAAYSRIDNMRVTVNPANWPAAIRVSYSGHGPTLQRSNVWITNNELFSGGEGREQAQRARVGIMILWGGVGVNVMNNRLHDFTLAGIQMGHGMNNVGDAMLTKVAYNEIRHDFGETGANTRLDNSGIYFDTHWVNPGNYLRCNYVYRGGHCLYIDWVSSGVISDGLVCDQTADGLKLNSGKNNMILGMVMINTTQFSVGYISCQNNHLNNCDNYAGPNWNRLLKTYFQTPEIRWNYPYLTNFCGKNRINGIDCNNGTDAAHSRAVTSGCSGLPTENYAELVSATPSGSPKYVIYMPNCAPFPSVPALNRMRYFATSIDKAGFRDPKNGDYGLRSNSEVLKRFPQFRSCPKQMIGPKPQSYISYFNLFNVPLPSVRPALRRNYVSPR